MKHIYIVIATTMCVQLMQHVSSVRGDTGTTLEHEERLVSVLLKDMDIRKLVRPAVDGPVKVDLGVGLEKLMNVDEIKHTIEMHGRLTKKWKDSRLSWNPADYGGLNDTRLPYDSIWHPDIALYNGAYGPGESSGFGHVYSGLAVVKSDGSVLWVPNVRLQAFCLFDTRDFPYDTQTCKFTFGSWTYDGSKVDVDHLGGQDQYVTNAEWELVDHKVERISNTYDCCPEPYVSVDFSLSIRRTSAFYTYMVVLPALAFCWMLPCIFLIPIGRPEKFHLGGVILICLTFLTITLFQMMPTSHGHVSIIEAFNLANIMFAALGLGLSSLLLRLSCCTSKPPRPIRAVVGVLSKCCCMSGSQGNAGFKSLGTQDQNPIVMDTDPAADVRPTAAVEQEWLQGARVLDRILFVVFVVFSAINTCTIVARM